MKNFPNQASDFSRLRATLQTIDGMVERGEDVLDDGVLGYALARRQQYTFRYLDYADPQLAPQLEARITEEQAKPRAQQGARTNAREMRRTLLALGLLDDASELTDDGRTLLASAPGSWEERSLLSAALLGLTVTDPSGTSHPVQVMLTLLADEPSLHRDGLELALEARDDSPEEIARVRRLYRTPTTERHTALGAGRATIANAKKVFPTLAKTAGLVLENPPGLFRLSPDGLAAVGKTPEDARRAVRQTRAVGAHKTGRLVSTSTIARETGPSASPAPLTPEQQANSAALLAERTDKHQRLVGAMAGLVRADGKLFEDPFSYDMLFVPSDPSSPLTLFEMKSIHNDAAAQVRRAVGQLSFYHYFEVSPEWPERSVVEIAVFDTNVGANLAGYLASEDVAAIVVNEGVRQINDIDPDLLNRLRVPLAARSRS